MVALEDVVTQKIWWLDRGDESGNVVTYSNRCDGAKEMWWLRRCGG